jgi:hypothetical protein
MPLAGCKNIQDGQALGRDAEIAASQLGKHLLDALLRLYGVPVLHIQILTGENVY